MPHYPGLRLTAAEALLFLVLTSACDGDDGDRGLPSDQTWESTHFRYHLRRGDSSACQGVLDQLERHFALLTGYLGLSWSEGNKIDYYKFRDPKDYAKNASCPVGSASCTAGSSVMSPFTLQEHELVHAYLSPLGLPPPFFGEGVAVALACDDPFAAPTWTPNWRNAVAAGDRFTVYENGAWFVGFLLDRSGPARFIAFYDRLEESSSAEQIATLFEEVYGEPLGSAWSAAVATGARVRCVNLWACQSPPLVLDGSPQTLAQACDGSDNSRTFELAADTDLVMSYSGMSYYAPVRCDSASFVGVSSTDTGIAREATLAHVTAGKYFIRPVGLATMGSVPIRALSAEAYVRDCTQARPVDLGTSEFTDKRDLELTVPNDGQPWFIKLHVPSDWRLRFAGTESEHIMVCPHCDDLSKCQPFVDEVPLDGEGDAILRLTSVSASPGYKFDSGYTSQSFEYKRRTP